MKQRTGVTAVDVRRELVRPADGVVVDLGVGGSWHTLGAYPETATVIGVEPSRRLRRAAADLARSRPSTRVISSPAEHLAIPGGTVDHVVATFVLCSVASVRAALEEARRVLRPGGALLFAEHLAAEGLDGWRRHAVDLAPLVRRRGGCRQGRDPRAEIEAVFGHVEYVETVITHRGKPLRVIVGSAHVAAGTDSRHVIRKESP
jgi:SAM-dependent methyltransferase